MEKSRYDDYSTESFNVSDKTPMLGKTKQDSSFITKRCIVIVGVVVLISIVASLIIFSNYVFNMETPDPDNPPPPSSLPMGIYRSVGVVSNGGPCAQVGVDVMSRGGNAVDAAIATMLCDGVVCPQYMGVGGGFIMSLYNATTKKVTSIKSREMAPAAANATMYVKDPKSSEKGGLAIAVPGALRGYSTIYRLFGGKVSWESLFKPIIELCENGITISIPLAMALKSSEKFLKKDPMLKKIFFDEHTGHVKKVGDTYKLTKLGETMRVLSKEGSEALYNGSLTSQFVEDLRKVNGIITKEDLSNYVVEIEKTFQVNLKSGHTVHAGRPPTSGIVLAYILRILDGMLPAPNAALDVHRIVEAFKFAYGERSHLGDHKFVNVSSIYEKISSDSYMESVRRKITDNSTSLDPKFYGADYQMSDNHGTANIVVTDSSGNAVVVTSTINTSFGSGFMSPSTGIIMNNEMNDFSTPGATNSYGFPPSPSNFIKPGKRPMSSNCPTVITDKDGNFVLGAGAAGGSKITLTTAYICALKLWYNKTLKEALDAPRFYHQLMPMEIQYEYGMTRDVVQKLKEIGHPMLRLSHNRGSGATAIYKSPDGLIDAMPDFRRLGNCSGY